jgi:hypothetical protein
MFVRKKPSQEKGKEREYVEKASELGRVFTGGCTGTTEWWNSGLDHVKSEWGRFSGPAGEDDTGPCRSF